MTNIIKILDSSNRISGSEIGNMLGISKVAVYNHTEKDRPVL